LLARDEYLATENRILKRMLSDAERATLGEIGHRLGRKVTTASPSIVKLFALISSAAAAIAASRKVQS
jgi:hypothetical protein